MVIIALALVWSAIWQAEEQMAEDKNLSFFDGSFVFSCLVSHKEGMKRKEK